MDGEDLATETGARESSIGPEKRQEDARNAGGAAQWVELAWHTQSSV